MQTYPQINALNLEDALAALAIAEVCIDAIDPPNRPELQSKIDAINERIRRLQSTNARCQSGIAAN